MTGPAYSEDMNASPSTTPRIPRILIVGGGYVGLYTALRLLKKLRHDEAIVTVVDPRSYMTYQPFLARGRGRSRVAAARRRAASSGAARRRDRQCAGDRGEARRSERPSSNRSKVSPTRSSTTTSSWLSGRCLARCPSRGLAEWATGFKTVEEAIQLRNRVLECLDIAESTHSPAIRERNLNFVDRGRGVCGG